MEQQIVLGSADQSEERASDGERHIAVTVLARGLRVAQWAAGARFSAAGFSGQGNSADHTYGPVTLIRVTHWRGRNAADALADPSTGAAHELARVLQYLSALAQSVEVAVVPTGLQTTPVSIEMHPRSLAQRLPELVWGAGTVIRIKRGR